MEKDISMVKSFDIKNPDDITPTWLNSVLKEAGVLCNSSVIKLTKQNIADEKAWLSNVIRLEPKYDTLCKDAPESFVLKMLASSKFRESSYELEAYRREINFYKNFAQNLPIRLPKLFYSQNDSSCNLMLMEDLSYLSPADQVIGMKYEQVLTALESLAKVHASYWDNQILAGLDWLPLTNNIDEDFADNWESFVELCGHFIDPVGLNIGEKLIPHMTWLKKEINSRPKTLTHDDMKADNLLFGDAGTDEAVVILDWQFAIQSMAAIDVARLIGGSQTPTQRSGKQFKALRFWYDSLLGQGVRNYSWDEAQRDFKLGALTCLTFPVHFHKGIVRAEGRALEYIISLYSRLFSHVVEIEADSVLP